MAFFQISNPDADFEQPGFYFINVQHAAFVGADPESAKKTDNLTDYLRFRDLGVNLAAHRTLIKLTPGHNKTSLYRTNTATLEVLIAQSESDFETETW
jgi:hypothetical protein